MSKKFWKIKNNADNDEESAELLFIVNETWWGDEVTPKQFADDIRSLGGKDIIVRINSGGGDVFAAQAIYNQLKSYAGNVDVVIDGICASAATIISCAGKNVSMPNNAIFMIHNQVDPVMTERERMLALDALNDGSEVVAQMINIAKQNGNTAEEISEYVNAVKTQTANSSRDKGIAEIKKLVQDNISSGATQIAASPADNTANDIANQEKQKQFDDVLVAMNK